MIHVQDLRIETDVLPLFNFTHNAHAEEEVRQLLLQVPASPEAVLERQAIIGAVLANWDTMAGFSYSKIEFQEVYAFLSDVSTGKIVLETNWYKASLKLLVSEQERYYLRAKYVQTVLFWHRIYQHYLARINQAHFPESFRPRLTTLVHFAERLSLDDNAAAIQQDAFTAGHVVRLARVLSQVTEEELRALWEAFYLLEAYWSVASGVVRYELTFPRFTDAGFRLEEFYHPLVKNPVKNTLLLRNGSNVLLLTGPNMSGKSTLLKAVGLCVYLAHVGVGVPAVRCEIPFFSTIAVAINLSDSLRDGYSHFMAEIQNLKAVLLATQQPNSRSFAVFDELFRGTNEEDALAITQATVAGLQQFKNSYFFISTHLLRLDAMLGTQANVKKYHIDCALIDDIPVFSYQLKEGWSTLKIGELLFQREGLRELLHSPTGMQ
jgi:DNA mismatch repair protein MutS